jgi:3-methyl-2-oxobutanoate hydroxymethyltransferase
MQEKVTVPRIRSMKGGRIVCVTAYDAPSAELADSAGVDLILVGDSVGNVVLGYPSTLPVTLTDMIHHTSAVRRGCRRALLAADMPFGSYQPSPEKAVESAVALIQAGAEAVKLEGDFCEAIRLLTKSGIPVMGHIGMTPQSVHQFGGYRVQGRGKQSQALVDLACRIEDAGAFCLVLELVPAVVAEEITEKLAIPTIGIGAGIHCDGEIQVFHDILGLTPGPPFKHTRRFVEGREVLLSALKEYAEAVRERRFPTEENSF